MMGAWLDAKLEERGLANDTLVVYMGDNGFMWGEHGLVDKRAMYEPSIRVPFIAQCPDLTGPRTVDAMALNVGDVLARIPLEVERPRHKAIIPTL